MMVREQRLIERFNFADLPKDCALSNVCIAWDGEPLLLCEEGRLARPPRGAGSDAHVAYRRSTARAHHIVSWQDGKPLSLRVENTAYQTTLHIQPFRDGWLLAEARGGAARILDGAGRLLKTIDLGDGSEDIQTTGDGQIWVSYFDEGVFGLGIGQAGAICFDSGGKPIFKYNDFAASKGLPFIADCYTLNVIEDAVWLCYYDDFPLVRLQHFQSTGVWKNFGATKAVAVRGETVVRFPAYDTPFLHLRTLDSNDETRLKLVAPDGSLLSELKPPGQQPAYVPFVVRARGARIYVFDEHRLYEVP